MAAINEALTLALTHCTKHFRLEEGTTKDFVLRALVQNDGDEEKYYRHKTLAFDRRYRRLRRKIKLLYTSSPNVRH